LGELDLARIDLGAKKIAGNGGTIPRGVVLHVTANSDESSN